jgi:hypothetical protein
MLPPRLPAREAAVDAPLQTLVLHWMSGLMTIHANMVGA